MRMSKMMMVPAWLAALSLASALAAGTQETKQAVPAASGPLKISMVIMGGPKTPDSAVEKELEKRYNVDIEPIFMPAWEEKNVKLNLLMSDPKTMPDVIQWQGGLNGGMEKEYREWKQAGLLVDMLPYLKDHGKDILNYYSKDTLFFSYEDGKMFKVPGDVAEASTGNILLRGDWLEKLGMKAPTNVAELKAVAIAFTKNDPDGNGKNDTFGFSGSARNGLGAFGALFTPYGVDVNAFLVASDGTVKWGSVLPQTKDALALIRDLYKEGIFDPTMFTSNNDIEQWTSGKVGMMGHGIHHFNPGSALNKAFYANNPGAKMISLDPIKGPLGFASTDVQSVAGWCFISITKNAKDPARTVAFLNALNSTEGFKLYKFGVQGVHYAIENGQFKPLLPQEQLNAAGVNLLSWYLERKDAANIQNTPQVIEMFKRNLTLYKPMKEIKIEFKDNNRPMWAEYSGDLNTLRDTTFYDIITGKKDLSAFDDFVKKAYAQGGDKVEKEANDLYGKQKTELAGFDKIYATLK